MILIFITLVAILLALLYVILNKQLNYWEEKGIPYLKPWIIVGNLGQVAFRTKHISHVQEEAYQKFSGHRYFGFYEFTQPALFIRDLDLIKRICINDFDKFVDHPNFLPDTSDPFWNKNLFAATGEDWHKLRCILSPAFTSSKMKAMFGLMTECAGKFVDHFQKQSGTIELEMRDTLTRFTNDVISSCAFGIKCDSLEDRNNEFFLMGKRAFNFTGLNALKFYGSAISPKLMKLLNVKFFDKTVTDFFRRIVKETMDFRDRTGLVRPDLIHLLREAQRGKLKHDENIDADYKYSLNYNNEKSYGTQEMKITNEDITIQCFIFFFGGYDTVASLLSQIVYELAVNSDVQNRLTHEVEYTLEQCNGKITYQALMAMKYMDMVVSETLRMWSPAIFGNRKAVKPYVIEPKIPGEKPLHIEVGTTCLFPIYAIQRDPKYFPDPNKFDPERFSDENKKHIQSGSYFPFGMGPRFCIGNRFALLEVKVLVFFLLTKFSIIPTAKTTIPLVLESDRTMFYIKNGYWLGLKHKS